MLYWLLLCILQKKICAMRLLLLLFLGAFGHITANSQVHSTSKTTPDSTKKIELVEMACGECQFGLHGKSCDLAVRINGRAYFVDGAHIDSLGDAHAKDGFCNAIRKATVQGELVNNRYAISYISLLKQTKDKSVKK